MLKWFHLILVVCLMVVGVLPASAEETININSASAAELDRILDGVGEVKSKAIVEYRTKHGPFKKPEDIRLVNGIGKKTFEKNAERIRVSDPSTPATPKQSSSEGTETASPSRTQADTTTNAPASEAVR